MRLVLFTFFCLLCLATCANCLRNVIQCGSRLFCNDQALGQWYKMKAIVEALVNFQSVRKEFGNVAVKRNSSLGELLEWRARLCMDNTITAFLLDDDVKDDLRCIWPGTETSIACAPVPSNYTTEAFTYIPVKEMRRRILKFREVVGCTPGRSSELTTKSITELFVCKERCVQAGIGYFASCLIMIVVTLTLILRCLS